MCLLTCLFTALPTFGLWGQFPNDEPIEADNWPQPVVKAINACRRVSGAGSWDAGFSFYFVGNTDDVNQFLAQVAEDKDAILQVVLDPDPGSGKTTRNFDEPRKKIDYAWSLHLWPNRQGRLLETVPGETEDQFHARAERELAKLPEFRVTVAVHCCGSIDPELLKIPLQFNASVGGRLAEFAEQHNLRREDLKAGGKSLADKPPTDMAGLGTGTLFTNDNKQPEHDQTSPPKE